uniref:Uncharacterized protein n=1 Tax=Ditylenchus dipsaci TaxID=166011 RepID=A0A915DMP1_9BILA
MLPHKYSLQILKFESRSNRLCFASVSQNENQYPPEVVVSSEIMHSFLFSEEYEITEIMSHEVPERGLFEKELEVIKLEISAIARIERKYEKTFGAEVCHVFRNSFEQRLRRVNTSDMDELDHMRE